jgi:hypothetical protein
MDNPQLGQPGNKKVDNRWFEAMVNKHKGGSISPLNHEPNCQKKKDNRNIDGEHNMENLQASKKFTVCVSSACVNGLLGR